MPVQLLKVKVPGTKQRRLYRVINWGDYDEHNIATTGREEVSSLSMAHVVSSLSPSGIHHRPVLDIDIPATLVPSSTPGDAQPPVGSSSSCASLTGLLSPTRPMARPSSLARVGLGMAATYPGG